MTSGLGRGAMRRRGWQAHGRMVSVLALLLAAFGLPAARAAATPTLVPVPIGIHGLSADGSTVAGEVSSEAALWTATGGTVGLGHLPGGVSSEAYAVSGNGAVAVGSERIPDSSILGSHFEAFRWTASGGIAPLGVLPGYTASDARGVSADGSKVVGWSSTDVFNGNLSQAFLWTAANGLQALGALPGAANPTSIANGISADGSTVVGSALDASGLTEAFRWTASGGMVGLGILSNFHASTATAASPDGSTIVGSSSDFNNAFAHPFLWTAGGGMVDLGLLGGADHCYANGVSADGGTVVGSCSGPQQTSRAFIWTGGQLHNLTLVAENAGLDPSWDILGASGISADGRTILVAATDPSGVTGRYLLSLPEPGSDALLVTGLLGVAVTRRRHA